MALSYIAVVCHVVLNLPNKNLIIQTAGTNGRLSKLFMFYICLLGSQQGIHIKYSINAGVQEILTALIDHHLN